MNAFEMLRVCAEHQLHCPDWELEVTEPEAFMGPNLMISSSANQPRGFGLKIKTQKQDVQRIVQQLNTWYS